MINYEAVFEEIDNKSKNNNEITIGNYKPITTTLVVSENVFDIEVAKSRLGVDKVNELVQRASGFCIETDVEAEQGLSLALSTRKLKKDIEKNRKELTEPALKFQRTCIAIEKEYTEQLSDVESELLCLVEIYQEDRKLAMQESGIIDESFDNLKTEMGTSSIKSYFEYKIVDIEKIPKKYLKIDSKKVQEDVKNGIRNIEGLEIFEVKKHQFRLKSGRQSKNNKELEL